MKNARSLTSFHALAFAAASCFAEQETAPASAAPAAGPQLGTFDAPTPSRKLSAKTIIGNVKKAILARGGMPDMPERPAVNADGTPKVDADGNPVMLPAKPAEYVELMKITGQCTGIDTGTTTYGEWVAYKGDFHAVNMATGEIFKGTQIYVPQEADIVMRAPIEAALKDVSAVIEIGVSIEAKLTSTQVGYQYRARPLMDLAQPESRSQKMLQAMLGGQLQLGATKRAAIAAPTESVVDVTATEKKDAAPAAAAAPAQAAPAAKKANKA
jgi:hypothetical protein